MKKVALVTDSTADLTEETIKEFNIHVIPLKVRFTDREYIDGELSSDEFYQQLARASVLPRTSQPSPEEFKKVYRALLADYEEIVSIHLSSGLSGTINAARLGKEGLKGKIHIMDSKCISLGTGLLVLEAGEQIKKGLKGAEVVEKLVAVRRNIETLFTVNTLEYLQKGGRIGKVNGLVGSLLNIKPIIRVGDDGIYHTHGMARSQTRALQQICTAFQNLAKGRRRIRLAVAHGAAAEAGLSLKGFLEKTFQLPVTVFTQVGPVIGAHTGPGVIGAAIQFE
ncbi:MAG TPA: DegV family protein [Bacillota bacterium]